MRCKAGVKRLAAALKDTPRGGRRAGQGGRGGHVAFSTGKVNIADVVRRSTAATGPRLMPVGVGKPLTVIIRHLYTGRFPRSGVFGGSRQDVLVATAVRDVFTSFKASPRAVNITKKRVSSGAHIAGLHATEDGTPLVFYSPSVTMVSTTVTVEMAFDDFPDQLVSRVGGAIQSAGGVPLFGPYGPVLIGVGVAIKLVSSVANALTDAKAEFTVSERLDFDLPDGEPFAAGYKVLCEPSFDPSRYTFVLGKGLVDGGGKPYDGPEPYAVLLVDGTKQDAFKAFTATAATAALLERFLQQKEGSDIVIDGIVSGVKLLSDVTLRREADRLSAEMTALDPRSEEYKALKTKRDALVANITEPLLKPHT